MWAMPALVAARRLAARRRCARAPTVARGGGAAAAAHPARLGGQRCSSACSRWRSTRTLAWLPVDPRGRRLVQQARRRAARARRALQAGPAFLVPVLAARAAAPAAAAAGDRAGRRPPAGRRARRRPASRRCGWCCSASARAARSGSALILPMLRGGDAPTVASLTAMALCVGYLVAATGPWLLGAVHDASGDWTVPLVVLIAITLAELVPGVPARPRAYDAARVMDTRSASSAPAPPGCCSRTCSRATGIESVVLEARTPRVRRAARARRRARAGHGRPARPRRAWATGCTARGWSTTGIELRFGGRGHRIDLSELTGGRAITVYGQQEVVKDLIAARLAAGGELLFEVADVGDRRASTPTRPRSASATTAPSTSCAATSSPAATASTASAAPRCPRARCDVYEREYPFAWLGILARAAPSSRGADLRAPRARLRAAQHALARGHAALPPGRARRGRSTAWPDERIWEELQTRLRHPTTASRSARARSSRRASRRCASFVAEPMRTAGCSWPATPRTSCRRPAPRG